MSASDDASIDPPVAVGDAIAPWTVTSVDPERMKTMAALLADPNPIHWDIDAVRALGMGDRPINQGPTNMAYIANMLAAWTGGHQNLLALQVRFLANVFAGDLLVAGGVVTAVRQTDHGTEAECEVWLDRHDGGQQSGPVDGHTDQRVLSGHARVVLPGPAPADT